MLLVGLTGGIAAGKTTVAAMLAERGAVVVDADDLARRAVEPGSPGLAAVRERFGEQILTADGSLDRERMAAIAFSDPDARRALEAIVHPEVARLFAEEVGPWRASDRVVVYAVPLLVERGIGSAFDVVVVVRAPSNVRLARLAAERGMGEEEALRRMQAQASDEDREAAADVVVDNAGSRQDLVEAVEDLWRELTARMIAKR